MDDAPLDGGTVALVASMLAWLGAACLVVVWSLLALVFSSRMRQRRVVGWFALGWLLLLLTPLAFVAEDAAGVLAGDPASGWSLPFGTAIGSILLSVGALLRGLRVGVLAARQDALCLDPASDAATAVEAARLRRVVRRSKIAMGLGALVTGFSLGLLGYLVLQPAAYAFRVEMQGAVVNTAVGFSLVANMLASHHIARTAQMRWLGAARLAAPETVAGAGEETGSDQRPMMRWPRTALLVCIAGQALAALAALGVSAIPGPPRLRPSIFGYAIVSAMMLASAAYEVYAYRRLIRGR